MNSNHNKPFFILTIMLMMVSIIIHAQEKPFWTNGFFYDAQYSYIEVVTALEWSIESARKKAYQEIINRRSLATGTDVQVVINADVISVESNHDLIVKSRIVDEFVEPLESNKYKIYLLVQTAKHPAYDYDVIVVTDKYPFSARSFVPGWQQIYKGSKLKGGLIIGGEILGIGGLATCFGMKSQYSNLIQQDPKHTKEYGSYAETWQNIGYGFVAFTLAVYLYNIIDAAAAPGKKRIFIDNKIAIAPSISTEGNIGLAFKYKF